jgi:hypothetical protein
MLFAGKTSCSRLLRHSQGGAISRKTDDADGADCADKSRELKIEWTIKAGFSARRLSSRLPCS